MNNEEGRAGSALADRIWVLEISFFLIATWQSEARLMKIYYVCVRVCILGTLCLYFWHTLRMTTAQKKKKKTREVCWYFREKWKWGELWEYGLHLVQQNDGLLSIVFHCALGIDSVTANTWAHTHTLAHTCLSSICVSIFRGYKMEAHIPLHFFKLNNWNIL